MISHYINEAFVWVGIRFSFHVKTWRGYRDYGIMIVVQLFAIALAVLSFLR